MEPQNTQSQAQPMDINQAKASLGLATALNQQFFNPKQQAQPEKAPQQEQSDLQSEFESFKKEMASMIKEEIGGIRKEIEKVVSEESTEDNGSKD